MSTMKQMLRDSETRLDKRRRDLESQIENMAYRSGTRDPETSIAILEAKQRLLELELDHRKVLSAEAIIEATGQGGQASGAGIREPRTMTAMARETQKRMLMDALGDRRTQTVEEALKNGLDKPGVGDPSSRAIAEAVAKDHLADVGMHYSDEDVEEAVAPLRGTAAEVSSGVRTMRAMANAGKHGAQVAAAAAANKELVDLVKSLAGDSWPAFLDTPVGRSIAELAMPSVLLHLVHTYPDTIPQGDLVSHGCELAVEAVSRDTIEPLLHMIVPFTKKLAQAGSSVMASEMDRVRGHLDVLDEPELEPVREPVCERATKREEA